MHSGDYLYLAKKDIVRFKLRTTLSIAIIAIGILASIINLYHTSKRADELITSFSKMGSEIILKSASED